MGNPIKIRAPDCDTQSRKRKNGGKGSFQTVSVEERGIFPLPLCGSVNKFRLLIRFSIYGNSDRRPRQGKVKKEIVNALSQI